MNKKSIAQYVLKNIDKAFDKGWIKVYYQPVVRTITGQVCSAEALARWIDPDIGFLAPDKFIGTLEKSGEIYKLDCFIVEKVCSDIGERMQKGLPAVPVSVNFSRIDFEKCDMLEVVECAVRKYGIPRSFIRVEITESMILADEDLMRRMIDSFRSKGYDVWMDDFGSGYSCLSVLKDWEFDLIKFDMLFLSSMTEKSKGILSSMVTMAKSIATMTLAEGVEDEEQVNFLKRLGVEKLQGYFYGKPMPVDEFFEHVANRGLEIEDRDWKEYYDTASQNVRLTDSPLEIVEDDGVELTTLFMNDAYKKEVGIIENDLSVIDNMIYHTNSPLVAKYRDFADKLRTSDKPLSFYYTYTNGVLAFTGQALAKKDNKCIIKGSIRNTSEDNDVKKKQMVDNKLTDVSNVYETIVELDLTTMKAYTHFGIFKYDIDYDENMTDMRDGVAKVASTYVHEKDRKRYLEFMNVDTLKERTDASGKGYFTGFFRMMQKDKTFAWREIVIMLIAGTRGMNYLYCIKQVDDILTEYLDGKF